MKHAKVIFGLLAGLTLLLSAERALAQLPTTAVIIQSVSSGKVLDIPGWSPKNGMLIQQWDLNGGSNQKWRFSQLRNGYYAITNIFNAKVLDVPVKSTLLDLSGTSKTLMLSPNDGTPIEQNDWYDGLNQKWGVTILETKKLTAGTWYRVQIYNWNGTNFKYLDVPGFSTNNGAIIQQYHWTGGTNQQFWIGPY